MERDICPGKHLLGPTYGKAALFHGAEFNTAPVSAVYKELELPWMKFFWIYPDEYVPIDARTFLMPDSTEISYVQSHWIRHSDVKK
jgi:hypothetical protein